MYAYVYVCMHVCMYVCMHIHRHPCSLCIQIARCIRYTLYHMAFKYIQAFLQHQSHEDLVFDHLLWNVKDELNSNISLHDNVGNC
jgi:hypothetical protein